MDCKYKIGDKLLVDIYGDGRLFEVTVLEVLPNQEKYCYVTTEHWFFNEEMVVRKLGEEKPFFKTLLARMNWADRFGAVFIAVALAASLALAFGLVE